MKVSIIIPTYNRADKLYISLLSLTNQTFKDFEVIVCDDGSIDNTKEVVEGFSSQLNITYNSDNNFGGPAKPRNRGIRLAKGEIIAFLDSDDWWFPNKLEVSLKYLQQYDFIYHDLQKYNSHSVFKGIVKGRILSGDVFKNLLINGNCIPNSSVMIKRNIIELVGYFSEDKNLIAVEDYEYWLRVSLVTSNFFISKKH